jgi:hypothetical protein
MIADLNRNHLGAAEIRQQPALEHRRLAFNVIKRPRNLPARVINRRVRRTPRVHGIPRREQRIAHGRARPSVTIPIRPLQVGPAAVSSPSFSRS